MPRFMVDMTSGCAWLMWRTTTSTTGTGGTTLRAGGCRGELSTAGAGSPLVSTWMLCWGRSSRIFPLSDQKDSHAVVLVVMTHFALFLLFFTVVSVLSAMLGSTLATCSLVCCTQFQAGSTAGRASPQLQLRSPPWRRSQSLWMVVPSLPLLLL